jgi:hypothetical protein
MSDVRMNYFSLSSLRFVVIPWSEKAFVIQTQGYNVPHPRNKDPWEALASLPIDQPFFT